MSKKQIVINKYDPPFLEDNIKNQVTVSYNSFKNNINDILDEFGFVVVTDILNIEETDVAWNLLFDNLSNIVDHDKLKTINKLKDVFNTAISTKSWPHKSIPGIPKKVFCQHKECHMALFHGTCDQI